MKTEEIQNLLQEQRVYFEAGQTLPLERRIAALKSLKEVLKRREDEICAALKADLGKSREESYMCELGLVYEELNYMLRHIRKLAGEKRVATPLAQTAARSYVKPTPLGVVLIMSPWNYPLMLTLDPLVDALAAGNTVVLKPSAYAPNTACVLRSIVEEAFHPQLVCLVTGGREENQQLLEQPFDHIFFTGSQAVGKEVLRHAAERLTPVSLELGGKSPCIVDRTADLKLAARRIVFGKFLNCGQTCVAPDYILCDQDIREPLEQALTAEIHRQYGEEPLSNPDYGKIVNEKHFARILGLIEEDKLVCGGACDRETLRIEPTVLSGCTWQSPAMEEEIFGPVLPILTFRDLGEAVREINARPHPLALYLFTKDKGAVELVTSRCAFGGGCINDTIIHLATTKMGFGGVGASGMGAYHGQRGFETFSHRKSIVDKKTWLDLPMRYQPYRPLYAKIVRLFMH